MHKSKKYEMPDMYANFELSNICLQIKISRLILIDIRTIW